MKSSIKKIQTLKNISEKISKVKKLLEKMDPYAVTNCQCCGQKFTYDFEKYYDEFSGKVYCGSCVEDEIPRDLQGRWCPLE